MKQSKVSKFAYLAGLIDGEGSLTIAKHNAPIYGNQSAYSTQLTISLSDGRIIDWLYGTFGGKIYLKPQKSTFCKGYEYYNSEQYCWFMQSHDLTPLLKRTSPFLKLKKEQAQCIIRMNSRLLIERKRENNGRFTPVSKHEIEIRESIYQQIKRLNHIKIKSSALETKRIRGSIEASESNSPATKENNLVMTT